MHSSHSLIAFTGRLFSFLFWLGEFNWISGFWNLGHWKEFSRRNNGGFGRQKAAKACQIALVMLSDHCAITSYGEINHPCMIEPWELKVSTGLVFIIFMMDVIFFTILYLVFSNPSSHERSTAAWLGSF